MNAVNAVTSSAAIKPAPGQYLAVAKKLAALVDGHGATSEDAGDMSSEVFTALKSAGLYWAMIPQEAGGGGLDLLSAMDIWTEISRADASTGWTLMAGSAATAGAYGFVAKTCADQIFGGKEPRLVGGMFGPGGTSRIGSDGIEYQGRFSFGSGCRNAEWFGGGSIVMNGDSAVFQQEFSHHEASYQACMALMISTYDEAQRDLYAGRELSVAMQHVLIDPIGMVQAAPAIMDGWRKQMKPQP